MKGYQSQHSRNGWTANKNLKSVHEPGEGIWSAGNIGIRQYLERWSLSLGLNVSVAENGKGHWIIFLWLTKPWAGKLLYKRRNEISN